jgi:hypothetical protein
MMAGQKTCLEWLFVWDFIVISFHFIGFKGDLIVIQWDLLDIIDIIIKQLYNIIHNYVILFNHDPSLT